MPSALDVLPLEQTEPRKGHKRAGPRLELSDLPRRAQHGKAATKAVIRNPGIHERLGEGTAQITKHTERWLESQGPSGFSSLCVLSVSCGQVVFFLKLSESSPGLLDSSSKELMTVGARKSSQENEILRACNNTAHLTRVAQASSLCARAGCPCHPQGGGLNEQYWG